MDMLLPGFALQAAGFALLFATRRGGRPALAGIVLALAGCALIGYRAVCSRDIVLVLCQALACGLLLAMRPKGERP